MPGVKGRSGGQNRKSRLLHILQGTFQPCRDRGDAPEPPAGAPEPPGLLAGEAKAEWDRMIVRLTASKTLSTVDGALLWSYCHLWADACRLQADADAFGKTWYSKTSVDHRGIAHQTACMHPVFSMLKQYRLALRVLLVEFGLTPLSRSRVLASPEGATGTTIDPRKEKYLRALT